jgi:aminoglycoside/choline kinase family phosphotransferase
VESDTSLPKPWIRGQRLAGDASSRRYARIWDRSDRTAILARYPTSVRSQMARDLEVRAWCAVHGLRVPDLLDHDPDAGWVVLEDFGPNDAEASLETAPLGERGELACRFLGPLVQLAGMQPSDLPAWNPPLGGARLRWELAGFELWFLRHRFGLAPPPAVGRWLDDLATAIDEHPRRVCHRDYHLNNLFLLVDRTVGVIDYQDILIGPDTYDAVSFLGERGLPRVLAEAERVRVQESWALDTAVQAGWRERWLLVRAQRALKVLGTFARLVAGGVEAYEPWMENLARQIVPELAALDAPSELVDLLLDLSRRRRPGQDDRDPEATPT